MFKFLLLVTSLTAYTEVTAQRQPGARVVLSQAGLDFAARMAVDVLDRDIRGRTVPDQSGTSRVDVGNVRWSITNGRVLDFTKPTPSVEVNPTQLVTWSMSNAGIKLSGNWRYEYRLWRLKMSDSGSFSLTLTGASASVSVSMTRGPDGRPALSVSQCSCTITGVSVEFRGGQSWLYNLFSGFVERPIRSELERLVCETATQAINVNGNAELRTVDVDVLLRHGPLTVDCRLMDNPRMANGYIESSHIGEARAPGNTSPIPFTAMPLPSTISQRMATIYMSEHIANTIGHVLYQRGNLTEVVTTIRIPDQTQPEFLSLSCLPDEICFGSTFPTAAQLYPLSTVELRLQATERPTLSITPTAATGRFTGDVDAIVRFPNGTITVVLSLGVTASLAVSAEIQGDTIVARVLNFAPSVVVKSSSLGGEHTGAELNSFLHFAANYYIIPQLNEIGLEGFRVPNMEGVQLVAPTLNMVQGALVLSTDVQYSP